MDKFSSLPQVTVINLNHAKIEKSFIPNVPDNYTCSKRQKSGKSFIPRFMIIYPRQAKKGKISLSYVNEKTSISFTQNDYCKPAKDRRSYIPRKTTKKLDNVQEKTQTSYSKPTSPLFGKSKIPVPASTKKTSVPTTNSTKKTKKTKKGNTTNTTNTTTTHTSHTSHNCMCVLRRSKVVKDDQARVLTTNANAINKTNKVKNDDKSISSIKKSLIPANKLILFKKRVSPSQPSETFTLIRKEELVRTVRTSIIISNKATNLVRTLSSDKHTPLQNSVNRLEASISISHSKVEVSTTTSIIKPELSSISLLYKAEKDLSNVRHQAEENRENVTFFKRLWNLVKVYF